MNNNSIKTVDIYRTRGPSDSSKFFLFLHIYKVDNIILNS